MCRIIGRGPVQNDKEKIVREVEERSRCHSCGKLRICDAIEESVKDDIVKFIYKEMMVPSLSHCAKVCRGQPSSHNSACFCHPSCDRESHRVLLMENEIDES